MAKSTWRHVGSVNLRGKMSKVLNCRCCVAFDLRAKLDAVEARRQMREGWPD